MIDRHIRLSTRFLSFFKGLSYVLLAIIPLFSLYLLWIGGDWLQTLPLTFSGTVLAISAILGMRKLRTVVWENGQMIVRDQQDIILSAEEIKNIELKVLIGVHEVTLRESHPYLGESFLFLASMTYLFSHDKVDDQMHELRKHIARSKRERGSLKSGLFATLTGGNQHLSRYSSSIQHHTRPEDHLASSPLPALPPPQSVA